MRPVSRAHEVRVRVQVWGRQDSAVRASSGGGRGGLAYVAVTVGQCLTYVYDVDGLGAHLQAWRQAAQMNRAVRLGEFGPPLTAQQGFAHGQDLAVVCHVNGEQPVGGQASAGSGGRPVMTVTVGAVSTTVHTTTALLSYLDGWTRAGTAQVILARPGE